MRVPVEIPSGGTPSRDSWVGPWTHPSHGSEEGTLMYTKQNYIDSVAHETNVIKHIYSKATPAQADYRPAEGIRSNLELAQYLAYSAIVPTKCLLDGDWSTAGDLLEESSTMKWEEFPARMDAQLEAVKKMMADVPDGDLLSREAPMPWGVNVPLGAGLIDSTVKFMSSYRLQFFNNVKISAPADAPGKKMGTANAWLGVDQP